MEAMEAVMAVVAMGMVATEEAEEAPTVEKRVALPEALTEGALAVARVMEEEVM